MTTLLISVLVITCYMLVTRNAFKNDLIWIKLAEVNRPVGTPKNPVKLMLRNGVFRVKIGKAIRNISTQEPMAIDLTETGIVIQQHNYLCRNGGKAIELKWEYILSAKKRHFVRLKAIDIEYEPIGKTLSIICVTKKSEKLLDEILKISKGNFGGARHRI